MARTEVREPAATPGGSALDDGLPDPKPVARRLSRGPLLETFTVALKTVTPILGGSTAPRVVDQLDFIRGPSIRGHLRFWWRALYGHTSPTAHDLAERERSLWGGIGKDLGTRSSVELLVKVTPRAERPDISPVGMKDKSAYALWTARAASSKEKSGASSGQARSKETEPAQRWQPGLSFALTVWAPRERITEIKNTVRAWILWGGYGGRTRRGLGGLTVERESELWLPTEASGGALRKLFSGVPLFSTEASSPSRDVPQLQGARMLCGLTVSKDAADIWETALDWLKEFRQGRPSKVDAKPSGAFAREYGDPNRPGRSWWPEPDNVRLLCGPPPFGAWAHVPRAQKSSRVAWPRAGFGLPIAFRFQQKNRKGQLYWALQPQRSEPDVVELRWRERGERTAGELRESEEGEIRERLASPLIVKAMPLANGRFVPIALWLHRAWPQGEVVLVTPGRPATVVADSAVTFDAPIPPEDAALYAPLQAGSLCDAFLGWLKQSSRPAKEIR
ncbi:type III-B CRISPR module RAMP protein Cmr1 [Corallococcus sp. H22C18031201]|nr:type III-B CRISPR module RAMP protein Cmr1 [Corallococcus sp. H22C18031201]